MEQRIRVLMGKIIPVEEYHTVTGEKRYYNVACCFGLQAASAEEAEEPYEDGREAINPGVCNVGIASLLRGDLELPNFLEVEGREREAREQAALEQLAGTIAEMSDRVIIVRDPPAMLRYDETVSAFRPMTEEEYRRELVTEGLGPGLCTLLDEAKDWWPEWWVRFNGPVTDEEEC